MEITKAFDDLGKILRLVILILFGSVVSGVYRIVKYFETKNTTTLIVGLLGTFTGIGNLVLWAVDIFTTVVSDEISFLAD